MSKPAVMSDDPEASAEVESEKPAINDGSENLIVQSLDISDDHDGDHGNVEDPDENSSARFANQAESENEDPVENPIECCDRENNDPEGEGDDRDDA